MNKLCKSDLVTATAQMSALGKDDCQRVIDTALQLITEQLAGGGDVQITGFGTFKLRTVKARQGRNPRTGQPVDIKASFKVKFGASSILLSRVNQHDLRTLKAKKQPLPEGMIHDGEVWFSVCPECGCECDGPLSPEGTCPTCT